MFSRLLYLEPVLLRRCWPFFGLYLLLFAALTLADGLSLALFVQRAGAQHLPVYYALSALGVLATIAWYMRSASRHGGSTVFQWILAGPMVLFLAVWFSVAVMGGDQRLLGALFLGREIAFALVLLHFGTWLHDFFSRNELNRVMAFIYSGGRVGGIAGGALLEHLSQWVHPLHLLALLGLMLGLAMVAVDFIRRWVQDVEDDDLLHPAPEQRGPSPDERCSQDDRNRTASPAGEAAPPSARSGTATPHETAETAPRDLGSFFLFLFRSPLMFWITVTTAALFACRILISFQYNSFFETAFTSDAEMARFLGRYTQIALIGSLLVQLLLVNRLVALVGLKGAHLVYATLLAAAATLTLLPMTMATAILARLAENELRFALRNPIAQMIVNQFSKATRLMARAWSLGLLIPLSTFGASVVLALMLGTHLAWAVPLFTALLGLGYLTASLGLIGSVCEGSPTK